MDHLDQAIYDTIHNSELSAKEIASRLGMNYQVLLNKANPQSDTHKLTMREAVAIMLMTGNHRIFSAIGTELDIDQAPKPNDCLLTATLAANKETGDVNRAIQESLEDGRFTHREKETTCREIDEAIQTLQTLKQTVVEHDTDKSLKAVS